MYRYLSNKLTFHFILDNDKFHNVRIPYVSERISLPSSVTYCSNGSLWNVDESFLEGHMITLYDAVTVQRVLF